MPRALLDILYEDADYVAVMKPAGLAAIPGRVEPTSAVEVIAGQVGLPWSGQDDPRLRLVHRIDKDTSGVLAFAKHRVAQRHLSHQFQNNRVEKEYVTIVAGRPPAERGEVDAPLATHPKSARRMGVSKQGRPALTLWQVEARYRNGLALLRVFPRTGKTHQIRVHLLSIGLPLAIDPLYHAQGPDYRGLLLSSFKRGYRPCGGEERPLIDRLTLHAEKLRFVRLDGTRVEVVAPLPKDLRSAINMLGKFAKG